MELSNIYELWDRFDRSDVVEMELDMDGVHFSLKTADIEKGNSHESRKDVQLVKQNYSVAVDQPQTFDAKATKSKESSMEEEKAEVKIVKAPLVGTFYIAPSPDADPFVTVGQEVHKGDVIGIVEAMKLMNEVLSDVDGVVTEILAQDGTMVEYNQGLIALK